MAYTATPTVRVVGGPGGRRQWLVSIVETEAAAASEWSIEGLPAVGTITHYQATLVSGAGATIAPKIGKATGWSASTQNEVMPQLTAAAHINRAVPVAYALPTTAKLFGRSSVNAGSDNVIHTTIVIVEGHAGSSSDDEAADLATAAAKLTLIEADTEVARAYQAQATPTLAVVAMATGSTEYAVAIAAGKKRTLIRLQDPTVAWRWTMTSGQAAAGTAGLVWQYMAAGEALELEGPLEACTVYVASSTATQYASVASV